MQPMIPTCLGVQGVQEYQEDQLIHPYQGFHVVHWVLEVHCYQRVRQVQWVQGVQLVQVDQEGN